MTGPLTVESVREWAEAVKYRDPDERSWRTQELFAAVLRSIAEGHPFARLVAEAALNALVG